MTLYVPNVPAFSLLIVYLPFSTCYHQVYSTTLYHCTSFSPINVTLYQVMWPFTNMDCIDVDFMTRSVPQAGWVPPPLSYIAELFGKLTPHEIALLLVALNSYIMVRINFGRLAPSPHRL